MKFIKVEKCSFINKVSLAFHLTHNAHIYLINIIKIQNIYFYFIRQLAGPRFGFARNEFEFVLIGAYVHALIALLQPVITIIYFCYSTDLAFLRRPKRPPSFKDLTKGYLIVKSKVLFPERYICAS